MSLSQKILESTEVLETDDTTEKSVEERDFIINNIKNRIKRLEVDMAHLLKKDFDNANRKRNEPIH